MPWLVIVPVLWLCGWITAARKDAEDKRQEQIRFLVKSNLPRPVGLDQTREGMFIVESKLSTISDRTGNSPRSRPMDA